MPIIERSLQQLQEDIHYRHALVAHPKTGQGDDYDYTTTAHLIHSIDWRLDQLATVLAQYDNVPTRHLPAQRRD